ncbi:hypothetical protein [Nocardioides acrostichi]|uniref:Uncharacterized protein n=1 Tax=Nocardioides acrostichi TaxID=2784339 RepID=A0A930V0A6_9ACTN|nr:hypothetical protein [Nocardioides acrostichi]MBF4161387.1 hypothetical protein [Nocardioides acrostichi]
MTSTPVDNPERYRLEQAVRVRLPGSGYVIHLTDDGFALRRDLRAAALLRAQMSTTMTHEVREPGDGTFTVVDVERAVTRDPTGRLTWGASASRGHLLGTQTKRTYRWNGPGFTLESEVSVDLGAGRRIVEEEATGLGLRQKRGAAELVGLFFAVLAVGGLLICGVVALALWLTGALR